jgi:hypothetical protein
VFKVPCISGGIKRCSELCELWVSTVSILHSEPGRAKKRRRQGKWQREFFSAFYLSS